MTRYSNGAGYGFCASLGISAHDLGTDVHRRSPKGWLYDRQIERRDTIGFLFLVLLCCTVLPFTGCSPHPPSVYGLLDQISDNERSGPWRLVAQIDENRGEWSTVARSRGLERTGGILQQTTPTSEFRIPSKIRSDERALITLAYNEPWRGEGRIAVRLAAAEAASESKMRKLNGRRLEFMLPAPESGADGIEIRHRLKPGTQIPLHSLFALAIADSADSRELKRARVFLQWISEDESHNAYSICHNRKVSLSRQGCTRSAVVLAGGDTLTLEMPKESEQGLGLRFWIMGLRIAHGKTVQLQLQIETENGWDRVGSWSIGAAELNRWQRSMIESELFPNETRRVRFLLSGGDCLVAVAEPMLLFENKATSSRLNLILVDLDTMRADRLGCYGYATRMTSPRLDSLLAARGFFVFKNAYSAAPWTPPATAKFLTSRYLGTPGIGGIARSYTTLAETLRQEG